LHRGIVGLQCGVVLACRQAGTGKKAGKFVSFDGVYPERKPNRLRTSILRQLGEKSTKYGNFLYRKKQSVFAVLYYTDCIIIVRDQNNTGGSNNGLL